MIFLEKVPARDLVDALDAMWDTVYADLLFGCLFVCLFVCLSFICGTTFFFQ